MARPIELSQPDVDLEARAAEKQASRDADARALALGEKTVEQLRCENSLTAAVEFVPIDYTKVPRARIR